MPVLVTYINRNFLFRPLSSAAQMLKTVRQTVNIKTLFNRCYDGSQCVSLCSMSVESQNILVHITLYLNFVLGPQSFDGLKF
jgi:hypothetical protein